MPTGLGRAESAQRPSRAGRMGRWEERSPCVLQLSPCAPPQAPGSPLEAELENPGSAVAVGTSAWQHWALREALP